MSGALEAPAKWSTGTTDEALEKRELDGQSLARPGDRGRKVNALACVLLVLFAVQGVFSSLRTAPTIDEFAHVPAGHYYYHTGDFSFFGKNPPLARLIMAAPLLLFDLESPKVEGPPSGWRPWVYGTHFMRVNRKDYSSLFFWARLPILGLSILMGGLVFWITRRLHGDAPALFVLALFSVEPNLLGHSSLGTVDTTATFFMFAASIAFAFHLCRPGRRTVLFSGGLLGLALLTKYTAILLLLAFPVMLLLRLTVFWKRERSDGSASFSRTGLCATSGAIFLLSLVVLNLGYLGTGFPCSLSELPAKSGFLKGISSAGFSDLPLPLPFAFLDGFDRLKLDLEQSEFPGYLLGQWSNSGFRLFFPVSLFLKLPLALILAILAGCLSCFFSFWRKRLGLFELMLWIPLLLIGIMMAFFSKVNYGVRYVLPLLPFLLVFAGRWLRDLEKGHCGFFAAIILVSWNLLASLLVFPHYLSSVNELVGGRQRAPLYLLDSNLDWGQDLPELKRFLDEENVASVFLAYFGHVAPDLYGIEWEPAPYFKPPDVASGWLAVSANYVYGYPYRVLSKDMSQLVQVPSNAFEWLRDRKPDARAGASILLYRIEDLVSSGLESTGSK